MTGDGLAEVVVSIFDPWSQAALPPGTLLIYSCSGGKYHQIYRHDSAKEAGPPHLWYIEDLNSDGQAELVVSEATCGANTCTEEVQILVWTGAAIENRLRGSSADLPTPDIRLAETGEAGVLAVEVVSDGIISADAGPQRGELRRWVVDPTSGEWEVERDELLGSEFRIHVLHDAEAAAQEGDHNLALALYGKVAEDEGLLDWLDPDEERANLGAYARYKLALLFDASGQEALALEVLDEMRRQYPVGTPQGAFVEMVELYRQEALAGGAEEACRAVMEFVRDHSREILEPLGPSAFGYANREFTPADVCL
jgi:hypothetical protein